MRTIVRRLPDEFVERFRRLVPSSRVDALLNTFSITRPTTFRVNTLRAEPRAIREQLTEAGIRLQHVPWYDEAFIVLNADDRRVGELPAYESGAIYVQGLSSMLPPLVLQPQPGETVLDLTAAPGSKTSQLAALMQNRGTLIANDNNRVRLFKLHATVERQGATCVEVTGFYGETVWRRYGERFDRVLLDAPCSAEGRFSVHEPKSYHYWKPKKIQEMARKQKKLLYSAIHALKPGGTLVYSTCTFAPEENETVLDWALGKFGGAVELVPVELMSGRPMPPHMTGMGQWNGHAFHPSVRAAVRVLPSEMVEGFFIAKLVKRKSTAADGSGEDETS